MALGYLIAPLETVEYVVMGTYATVGLFSRIANPMNIARMSMELGFFGLLLFFTPDAVIETSTSFITAYVIAAYIGSMIHAAYRNHIMKKDAIAVAAYHRKGYSTAK